MGCTWAGLLQFSRAGSQIGSQLVCDVVVVGVGFAHRRVVRNARRAAFGGALVDIGPPGDLPVEADLVPDTT